MELTTGFPRVTRFKAERVVTIGRGHEPDLAYTRCNSFGVTHNLPQHTGQREGRLSSDYLAEQTS